MMSREDKTQEEIEIMYDAIRDIQEAGETDIRCPRCHNEIVVSFHGSSATAACRTEGCLEVTKRGFEPMTCD